jgi:non-canonical (house-cleaning) NTP pyrophosphatase
MVSGVWSRGAAGGVGESLSQAVRLPEWAVTAALAEEAKDVTVGDVLSRVTGCAHNDPHAYLTSGAFPRLKLLEAAVLGALVMASSDRLHDPR